MSLAIVTNGYLYSAMLVAALALAKPQGLGFRKTWEMKLAFALAFGIFLVAMWVFAEITSI